MNLRFVKLLFFFVISSSAFPWGDLGHSTVGYLAETRLTPKAKGFINSFMGSEPLAVSAVWPDLVRADERFADFAPFHYLEIPIGMKFKDLKAEMRAPKDAASIIEKVPTMLLDNGLSNNDKALLFRYLVHIVGDVHQPLHIGNGLDRGANLCDVKFKDPGSSQTKETNLHTLWDNSMVDELKEVVIEEAKKEKKLMGYFQYPYLGAYLEKKLEKTFNPEELSKISQATPEIWYEESQALHSVVYPDKAPVSDPKLRPYCKFVDPSTHKINETNYKKSKIPTLDKRYVAKVLPVIEERLFKAGIRLAQLLNNLAEKSRTKKLEKESEANSINKILELLKNKNSN